MNKKSNNSNNNGSYVSPNQQHYNNDDYTSPNQQHYNNGDYISHEQQHYNNGNYASPNEQRYNNEDYISPNQQHQYYNNSGQNNYYNPSYENYNNYSNSPNEYNRLSNQNHQNGNFQQNNNQNYNNYQQNNQKNFFQNNNLNNNFENNFPKQPSHRKNKTIFGFIAVASLLLIGGIGYYFLFGTSSNTSNTNEEELYAPILTKYKEAMQKNEVKPNSDINSLAILQYTTYGKKQYGDNYLQFYLYDIDGNGKKELIISQQGRLNSPFDVYTYDKDNNIIRLLKDDNDGHFSDTLAERSSTAFYKDKTVRIRHSTGAKNGGFVFYKFSSDGTKLEKTNDISYSLEDANKGTFKDSITNEVFNSKDDFEKKYPEPEMITFNNLDGHSVYNYDQDNKNETEKKSSTNGSEYSNAQLALIGTKLANVLPDYLLYDSPFTMGQQGNDLFTSVGTAGSIVKTNRTPDGIEISGLDYDKPAGQRDFKVLKKVSWSEIKEQITEEQMKHINRLIEEYKKTKNYETTHIKD